MSRIKLSLKELDQALELAHKHVTVFDEDGDRNLSIIARMVDDGCYDAKHDIMTAHGRAFYNSGGYAGQRRRRILRNIFVWLSTILAAFLGSLLATLL